MKSLIRLGIDESKFSSLDHARCQEIGAAAHFLEFDSLIVPSARWPCLNPRPVHGSARPWLQPFRPGYERDQLARLEGEKSEPWRNEPGGEAARSYSAA
jgi:hypothetical protein